ncbi:MAG: metal ABC transporter permease [Proteobacteria bacterium]|nr:metal ABC transporter permease [Pseudomonadota bacterium]
MHALLHVIFASGFLANRPVRAALAVGGGTAVVSAVVGVFTVMRGQSFAAHALGDVSSAGGSASYLLGVRPMVGFIGMGVLAAAGMEWADMQDARERDLATGVILGAGLALTALFLYLDTTSGSASGAAIAILFGSMFTLPATIVLPALAAGAVAVVTVGALYRPLLLSSLSAELAAAQGTRVRLVGLAHALALALAVSLSAMSVGAILSPALLIGPAATALRLVNRPGLAMALAALLGIAAVWGGILLAYDSYYWTPGHGWPVSFFIVSLIFLGYVVANVARSSRK